MPFAVVTAITVGIIVWASVAPDEAEPSADPSAVDTAGRGVCVEQLGDLADALGAVDSRLDIGLAYADYGTAIGDANVAYDQADFDALSAECIQEVGVPLENALNSYIQAAQTWDACINDTYCDIDTGQAGNRVQKEWSSASAKIAAATETLESWS